MVEEEIKESEVKPEAELSILKRVEAANLKAEEILKKQQEETRKNEEAVAKLVLGGRSYAGQTQAPVETEDEKWAREAKLRYAGTGLDPTPSAK